MRRLGAVFSVGENSCCWRGVVKIFDMYKRKCETVKSSKIKKHDRSLEFWGLLVHVEVEN